MGKRDALAKGLVIVGTVLVAIPIIAPVFFTVMRVFNRPPEAPFAFDYLMPFEAYPLTLIGLVLLLGGSHRSKLRRKSTGWLAGGMLGGVLLGGVAAKLTDIADSVETLEPWRYGVVIAFGAASIVAQIALIVVGVMLTVQLFKAPPAEAAPAQPAPPAPVT